MIYLISSQAHSFKNTKHIKLSKIKFKDINVNLKEFDTLITSSRNALKALLKSKCELNLKMQILTLSQKSAKDFQKLGFKDIKIPSKAYLKDLLLEFKKDLKAKKILYLRAEKIAFDLANEAKDLDIKELIAYESIYTKHKIQKLIRPCVFVFSSFELADNFLKYYEIKDEDKIVCIGSSTAKRFKNFKNLHVSKKQDIRACINLARKLDS